MEQAIFEIQVLKQLAIIQGEGELKEPIIKDFSVQFYDLWKSKFRDMEREEYTDFILSMIEDGLLSYDNHNFYNGLYDRWSIQITRKGVDKLCDEKEIENLKRATSHPVIKIISNPTHPQ